MDEKDDAKFAIIDDKPGQIVDLTTGVLVTPPPITRVIPVNFDKKQGAFVVPAEMKRKFAAGAQAVVHWVAPYPITVVFGQDPPDPEDPSKKEFTSKQIEGDLHYVTVRLGSHENGKELDYTIYVTVPPGVKVEVDPSIIIDTTYNRLGVRR